MRFMHRMERNTEGLRIIDYNKCECVVLKGCCFLHHIVDHKGSERPAEPKRKGSSGQRIRSRSNRYRLSRSRSNRVSAKIATGTSVNAERASGLLDCITAAHPSTINAYRPVQEDL